VNDIIKVWIDCGAEVKHTRYVFKLRRACLSFIPSIWNKVELSTALPTIKVMANVLKLIYEFVNPANYPIISVARATTNVFF